MHRLAGSQAVSNIDDRTLSVTIKQKVRSAIEQNGATNLVTPVVVVCDTPEARLNTANDQGYIAVGFPDPLAVYDDSSIRALAALIIRGIGVIVTTFFIGGVAVDH